MENGKTIKKQVTEGKIMRKASKKMKEYRREN